MRVTLYPAQATPKTVTVTTFTELQKLVGGYVTPAGVTPAGDLLVNEEGLLLGLPANQHYPRFVGDVVLAPTGWGDLPYGAQ